AAGDHPAFRPERRGARRRAHRDARARPQPPDALRPVSRPGGLDCGDVGVAARGRVSGLHRPRGLAGLARFATTQGKSRMSPFRVALTGGIASGKSTVAELLAARGVPVIDTDLI